MNEDQRRAAITTDRLAQNCPKCKARIVRIADDNGESLWFDAVPVNGDVRTVLPTDTERGTVLRWLHPGPSIMRVHTCAKRRGAGGGANGSGGAK